jgi:hypothetical protein
MWWLLRGCSGSVGDVVAQLGMWWLSRDVMAQLGMWLLSWGCGGSVRGCGGSVGDVVAS